LIDLDWLIPLGVLLLAMSAFLTATEVALFSLRRVDREQMARSGRPRDAAVLHLLDKPRRLVATVLVCNDAVNAGLAVTGLGVVGRLLPDCTVWACAAITAAAVLPLTLLIGEVLPRTLAQKAPMAWARASARPLQVCWFLAAPVRWVVHGTADLLLKPFGDLNKVRPRDLSEEEFKKLVDAGSAQGQVDQRERRLIHRVFEFGDKSVGQIMTPREKVFALSYDLPMARLVKEVAARGFSRVPIYTRSLDNVRGILNAKDLVLAATGQSTGRALGELLHDALFVPRTTPVGRMFRLFKQKKIHIALVVNEYGKLLGIVTMDDVLGQLFGDIHDERSPLQAAVRRARVGGRTPVPGRDTGPVGRVDRDGLLLPSEVPATMPVADGGRVRDAERAHARADELATAEAANDTAPIGPRPPPPGADTADLDAHDDHARAFERHDPDADLADASPVPIADLATGPSGPVAAARALGPKDEPS
jgi:CBS domain containing-hemolysin-like protein